MATPGRGPQRVKQPRQVKQAEARSAAAGDAGRRRRLRAYQAKRDFGASPEPSGERAAKRGALGVPARTRYFCVQKHLASHLHYDFRLEHRGVLLSWAVPKGPSLSPGDRRLAMQVEDHPLDYGSFEGVIPSGYGAGIVMLWDRGSWSVLDGQDDGDAAIDVALAKGQLKLRLDGAKLHGEWVLVRGSRDPRAWFLIKHRDEWAGDVDITTFAPRSVKTDQDFADILAQDRPDLWQSDRPAKGGVAGAMYREIIPQAARIRAEREAAVARSRGRPMPRSTRQQRR